MKQANKGVVLKTDNASVSLSEGEIEYLDTVFLELNRRRSQEGKAPVKSAVIDLDWTEGESDSAPVRCLEAGGGLIIQITSDALKRCAERHPEFGESSRGMDIPCLLITDSEAFAQNISRVLNDEADDGGNALTRLLGEAIAEVVESGCGGVKIPETSKE